MPKNAQPVPYTPPTDPATLKLETCSHCAGRGFQPTETDAAKCAPCEGGGFACVAGNLGSTRSHPKGRPFLFNAGTRQLWITRGTETTGYQLSEFVPQLFEGDLPARAFEYRKSDGEVHHLLISRAGVHCDCAGKSYETTARANWKAYLEERQQFTSAGCVHADSLTILLHAGLLDAEQPPSEFPDPESVGYTEE